MLHLTLNESGINTIVCGCAKVECKTTSASIDFTELRNCYTYSIVVKKKHCECVSPLKNVYNDRLTQSLHGMCYIP